MANTQPFTIEFKLANEDHSFGPLYPPDKALTFHKDRNLTRNQNMCEGEDVNDSGAKNREVTVTGLMRERERPAYEDVEGDHKPFMLETNGWTGWVRVDDSEYRGPVGWDPNSEEVLWRYKLDLVSTGKSEYDHHYDSGIIE